MIFTVLSCSVVAYGFARVRWPGRDILFVVCLATMMLPSQVTFIPLYVIYAKLGWVGTFLPLIVPSIFGAPFFIFLLRQFFLGIPSELSDAARIDGASDLQILWRIILPLSKPALITVGLFTFIDKWGDFFGPLDRILGYLEFRKARLEGGVPEFTCLVGTMVQETYATAPAIRAACERSITGHAATLEADIEAALRERNMAADWTAKSLALHTQAVLQGAFILAKATGGAEIAADSIDHLRRYIELLFGVGTEPAQPLTDGDSQ